MLRIAGAFILIACIISPYIALAGDPPDADRWGDPSFSINIIGGGDIVPAAFNTVHWYEYDDSRLKLGTTNKTAWNPTWEAGLTLGFYPSEQFIRWGLMIEALYVQTNGTFSGDLKKHGESYRGYSERQFIRMYQLNVLSRVYFMKKKFRPFLEAGIGPARTDLTLFDETRFGYGAAVHVGSGVEYRFTKWFGLSGGMRFSDIFGFKYDFSPSEKELVQIQSRYTPLSVLVNTSFFLF